MPTRRHSPVRGLVRRPTLLIGVRRPALLIGVTIVAVFCGSGLAGAATVGAGTSPVQYAGTSVTQPATTSPVPSASTSPIQPAAAAPGPRPIGQIPTVPAGSKSLGAADGAKKLTIDVVLQPSDPAALTRFATDVSTPGSADYHHYLTTTQFARRFGATDQAITDVLAALRSAGLQPGPVDANRLGIPVTATTAQVAKAFSTRFENYRSAAGGLTFANTSAPVLPAVAAAHISAIIGLDNINVPQPLLRRATPSASARPVPQMIGGGPQPCAAAQQESDTDNSLTADEFAAVYGMTGFYGNGNFGAGQTIAIYELDPYLPSDIAAFQRCYGTSVSVTNVDVDGGLPAEAGEGEAALDIETVLSLAPKAKVLVYQGGGINETTPAWYDTYRAIVNQNLAQVVSVSYGICELLMPKSLVAAENVLFQQAAAQGQTVLVSSGDSGSEACSRNSTTDQRLSVSDPGSQPFVTSVGGTKLIAPFSLTGEVAWNNATTKHGAGGGGLSVFWDAPSYQQRYLGATGAREVPDVSADADPLTGYVIFHHGAWTSVGGTSASAPLWAAIMALGNAGCSQPIGFANPAIYAAFTAQVSPLVGHDVQPNPDTPQNNNNDYTQSNDGAYPVLVGYDMATGWGSPQATTLTEILCSGSTFHRPTAPATVSNTFVGDFTGDGRSDIAVYRPSSGQWIIRGGAIVQWGRPGDIPLVGDFSGDRATDIAVYRPSTGQWLIRGQAAVQWGRAGDVPVAGDFNGDGRSDIAVYRPSSRQWIVRGGPTVQWGRAGDVPLLGDFDGGGRTDFAIYRPSTGQWLVRGQTQVQWGRAGDVPLLGDFDGDGRTDITVYRPSTQQWIVRGEAAVQWGNRGDLPLSGDFDRDGRTDIAVYHPATAQWLVRGRGVVQFGIAGDLPI